MGLKVHFIGEEAEDEGGPLGEFLRLMIYQISNPLKKVHTIALGLCPGFLFGMEDQDFTTLQTPPMITFLGDRLQPHQSWKMWQTTKIN